MMEELRLTTTHSLSSTMTSLYLRLPLIHWTSLSHSTTPPPTPSSSLPATVLVPVITPPSQPWRVSRTSQKIEVLRHSFPLQLVATHPQFLLTVVLRYTTVQRREQRSISNAVMGTRQISPLHHSVLIQHGTLKLWIFCVQEFPKTHQKVSI